MQGWVVEGSGEESFIGYSKEQSISCSHVSSFGSSDTEINQFPHLNPLLWKYAPLALIPAAQVP